MYIGGWHSRGGESYLYNLSGLEFWEDFIAADTVCKGDIQAVKIFSGDDITEAA